MSLFKSIYSFSACGWLVFGLYLVFSVQRFIVKRYEQETNLSDTKFFKEHLPFTKHLPSFFRSTVYSCHLILFTWAWKAIQKGKARKRIRYYDDINTQRDVMRYFSQQEIRRVKLVVIVLVIITAHVIGMDVVDWIWPDIF
jgi:hypothetical protein